MEEKKSYYENGNLKANWTEKDGKKEGIYKKYSNTGELDYTANYKDGNLNGKFTIYHENGIIQEVKTYNNGVLQESDYLNSQFCKKEIYENGQKKHSYYYELIDNIPIKRVEESFYNNGKIYQSNFYSSNSKEEKLYQTFYYGNDEITKKIFYNDDKILTTEYKKNGQKFQETDKNGNVLSVGNIENNTGTIVGYYNTGELKTYITIDNAERNIKNVKEYYKNGNLKEKTNYFPFNKKEYYENGEILLETYDKNNFRLSKGFIDNEVVSFSISKNKECDFHLFCLKDGKLDEVIEGTDKISYKGNEALNKYKFVSKLIGEDFLNLKDKINTKETRGRETRGKSSNEK